MLQVIKFKGKHNEKRDGDNSCQRGSRHKALNMSILGGKPLIDYTVTAAKKSELLTEFIISSDDKEIINHCRA